MKNPAIVLVLLELATAARGPAATITPDTLKQWDGYVRWAKIRVANDATHVDTLLSAESKPQVRQKLLSGSILALPAENGGIIAVPHGLIHHWVGTVFVPGASVESTLAVLQNYNSYSETYAPGVASSKLLSAHPNEFTYQLEFVERRFGIKTIIRGQFRSHFVQVDSTSGYSITDATDIAEVDSAGTNHEKRLSVADSHGYVENMFTILRYQERDGGTYLEVETMTLSRDIPLAIRWLVTPIVQNFSKDLMTDTLTKMKNKIGETSAFEASRREKVR